MNLVIYLLSSYVVAALYIRYLNQKGIFRLYDCNQHLVVAWLLSPLTVPGYILYLLYKNGFRYVQFIVEKILGLRR